MESVEDIFLKAREIADPAERDRYVAEACDNDVPRRQQVELMLREAEKGDDFFGPQGTVMVPQPSPLTEGPGSVIGRYKLLQKIGEGGMGVVYMAEQREPVIRKVALKIVKLGMDTRQVVARFEAERQALALMDHPNIAKVLEAGATETGRPYFVMELVRGIKITEYCDQNHLSTEQRLDLFIKVCGAVQHAHQKAIIHRDLKPSNILVADHDGVLVPKIIDFGIAKATTGQPLTDKTVFTEFEQFIGTPAYMSPEQAKLSGLDIDTRTDIYSLGVLLYELLTGHPPFDPSELLLLGFEEMRRAIRDQEPPRPSQRLKTMVAPEISTTAHHRRTVPPKLVSRMRGDLDCIVMKCLAKDRARRYETANALALDVERHLQNEPIIARAPSKLYEFQKSIQRHKFGFAAVTTLLLTLAAGVFFSTKEAIRAERSEKRESQLRQQAEQRVLEVQTYDGMSFQRGDSVQRDYAKAVEHYRQAAEKGFPIAQYRLAEMYATGKGVTTNLETAFKWYSRAAAQHHPGANFRLGMMYALGQTTRKDNAQANKYFDEATKLYRAAADQGGLEEINELAWFLATCAIPELRDATNALALAQKAAEMTGRRDPLVLDTLAAAYAECGKFDNAVETEKEALALLDSQWQIKEIKGHLNLFQGHTSYHVAFGNTNSLTEAGPQ